MSKAGVDVVVDSPRVVDGSLGVGVGSGVGVGFGWYYYLRKLYQSHQYILLVFI